VELVALEAVLGKVFEVLRQHVGMGAAVAAGDVDVGEVRAVGVPAE